MSFNLIFSYLFIKFRKYLLERTKNLINVTIWFIFTSETLYGIKESAYFKF